MQATLTFEVWFGPRRGEAREVLRDFVDTVTFVEKKGLFKSEFRVDGNRGSVMHVQRTLISLGVITV